MAITDYANWRNTFSNPQINQGIFGSAMNRNIFTPQALNFLGKARNVGGTALRYSGLTNPVGAAATAAYVTPKLINRLTERDANATRSSLFNIDLTKNANERAVLPSVGENAWGAEGMSPIPDDGVVPPIENINRPLPLPYQDRIMNKDLMNMDRGNIDNRGFSFNPLNWGIGGMMKRMVEPNTPEEDFGRNYFNMSSSGRALGNMAENVFAGKNVATGFGKGMGAAAQKRIDRIGNTIQRLTDLDEEKHRQTILNLRNRQNLFQSQQDQYQKDLAGATGGADTTVTHPGDGGYDRGTFTGDHPDTPTRSPSEGGWHPGVKDGGRIGYQGGELVEDESMMASDPNAMDSLNELSMSIFGKPIDALTSEEYEILVDVARNQAGNGEELAPWEQQEDPWWKEPEEPYPWDEAEAPSDRGLASLV